MTSERFGTTTNLYHRMHYNNRQQMYDIRLGTGSADDWSSATWNRGAIRLFYDSNFAFGNGGTNNNGNVYRMDHFVPTNESATTYAMSLDYYQYDALNRITGIWENKQSDTMGETSTGLTQQYVYDRYGNRTVNNAVSNFGVFNLPFNVDQTTNRLLAPNGTISYNAVGNQTNDNYTGAGTRTYDANNKLVSAATSSGTASYAYNANGSRVIKTAGGTTTWNIYGLDGELVAEYAANGAVGSPQKEYGYRGGQMLVVWDGTETGDKKLQWLVQDHLGSTRMVADLSGALTGMKRHDYLPFGEEIGAGVGIRTAAQGYPPPDDKIRQKFTGKERDVETGLDYFEARYFSSVQGRFSSPDEFTGGPTELFAEVAAHNPTFYADIAEPQSLNKYVYCLNNPYKFVDPDGHQATLADRIWSGVESVKQKVGSAATQATQVAIETANGVAAAFSEDNGLPAQNLPQNKAGRAIGHVLAGAQSVAEITGGGLMVVGGGSAAVATSPACATGVGCLAPVAGAATAVVGAVVTAHGAAVLGNTLNNVFSKKTELSKQTKDQTGAGAQGQLEGIEAKQAAKRKQGKGEEIRSIEKSKQNLKTTNRKKVQTLQDAINEYEP